MKSLFHYGKIMNNFSENFRMEKFQGILSGEKWKNLGNFGMDWGKSIY